MRKTRRRIADKWMDRKNNGRKGKSIPLQAWTGPDVSRRLRLPDFKTAGT